MRLVHQLVDVRPSLALGNMRLGTGHLRRLDIETIQDRLTGLIVIDALDLNARIGPRAVWLEQYRITLKNLAKSPHRNPT